MKEFNDKISLPVRLKVLLDLYQLKKGNYSFFGFERAMGYNKARLDVREVLSFLVESNILEFRKLERGIKTYSVNKKKLNKFIEGTEFFKCVCELGRARNPLNMYQY